MDKSKVKNLRDELQEVLNDFGKNHSVDVRVGNASFSESNVTFKVEVSELSSDGSAITKEVSDFNSLAELYGFSKEDLGKEVVINGERFTISGFKRSSKRYPILLDGHRGRYKMGAKVVLEALDRTKVAGAR